MATAKPVAGTALPSSNLFYPSIVAFWPFNDAIGTTLVDVKAGKNATINLPATITWGVNDKGEPAIVSAATSSTTRGASFSALAGGEAYYSIEFRFKPGASDNYGLVLGTANGSFGSVSILSGKVSVYSIAGETTVPSAGNWHHSVITREGISKTQYYLDGVADGSVANSAQMTTFDTMFNDTFSETFIATVDYIRVWNRILTLDEIVSLRDDPMQVFVGADSQPMMFVTT